MKRWPLLLAALGGAAAVVLACGAGDFDPVSKVDSVRMFGVRADKPYAKPGDTVTFTTLVTDARRDRPRPLTVYWIPVTCINPSDDLYYLCFVPGEGGAGATSALAQVPRDTDLSAVLPKGDTYSIQLPNDLVVPRSGTFAYGLAIVFNIACAGQVRIADRSGDNPQQVPIQCTDENGTALPPSDYVIGINRVYAYDTITNANPVVSAVTIDGGAIDMDAGITLPHCTTRLVDDCPPVALDVDVPQTSWETNPTEQGTFHEQIWVDYYSDLGKFKDDARLLYDTKSGKVTPSRVEYRAPKQPSDGQVWAVVHDNRSGAAFITFPLHVR